MSKTTNSQATDNLQISVSMKQFIIEHFPLARRKELTDADHLIESGVIDSMGVLDLVAFIESEFNVRVEDEDLTPENFQSIARITLFIQGKRNGIA